MNEARAYNIWTNNFNAESLVDLREDGCGCKYGIWTAPDGSKWEVTFSDENGTESFRAVASADEDRDPADFVNEDAATERYYEERNRGGLDD